MCRIGCKNGCNFITRGNENKTRAKILTISDEIYINGISRNNVQKVEVNSQNMYIKLH